MFPCSDAPVEPEKVYVKKVLTNYEEMAFFTAAASLEQIHTSTAFELYSTIRKLTRTGMGTCISYKNLRKQTLDNFNKKLLSVQECLSSLGLSINSCCAAVTITAIDNQLAGHLLRLRTKFTLTLDSCHTKLVTF
jgi:hypothetical protein